MQSDSQFETARPTSVERTKPRRRKKRANSAVRTAPVSARGRKYPGSGKQPGHEPPEHFHVNLSEIPFVTGKVIYRWLVRRMFRPRIMKSVSEFIAVTLLVKQGIPPIPAMSIGFFREIYAAKQKSCSISQW